MSNVGSYSRLFDENKNGALIPQKSWEKIQILLNRLGPSTERMLVKA